LAELEVGLPRHHGLAPTFSSGQLQSYDEAFREWEEDFEDPEFATFVAEHDGRVIGSAAGSRLEKSSSHKGLMKPDNAGFLGFAAVYPDARGLGAGRALGDAVLEWSLGAALLGRHRLACHQPAVVSRLARSGSGRRSYASTGCSATDPDDSEYRLTAKSGRVFCSRQRAGMRSLNVASPRRRSPDRRRRAPRHHRA
jgi:GNAT superfamily N-acetyltransferase